MFRSPLACKLAAEFLGTFALVFFGCGAVRAGLDAGAVAAVFGLTVAVMIYALGHICGAHFNPAVTLGFAAAKRFPFGQVLPYWAAQFGGAFLATGALSFLLPVGGSFGAAVSRHSLPATFGWETLLTFFLMLVIIAVATDSRAEGTLAGAAIGAFIVVGSLVGGPETGSAMNPARYLAPGVAEGKLEGWWIYLAGAFLGAVLAALLYERIRCEEPGNGSAGGCC